MTLRALILGLAAALLVAGGGYINDSVLRLNFLVGNFFPISVFGLLIVVMVAVNPLLYSIRPAWRLTGPELAVALAMVLAACSIPGSSLMRTFTPTLVMTVRSAQEPGMQDRNVLRYLPPSLLPAEGEMDREVMEGWFNGLGKRGQPIGLDRVPWGPWQGVLRTWTPIILLLGLCVICLSLLVHRQWATHERLRYPIIDFASAIMSQEQDRALGPVFRQKLFWLPLAAVLVYHIGFGWRAWSTSATTYNWPLEWSWPFILDKWPVLREGSWHSAVLVSPKVFPLVAAFAFFLNREISLSLGLTTLGITLTGAALAAAGANLAEGELAGGPFVWQRFGSYLGLAIILIYIGRRYYGRVLAQALTFRPMREVEPYAAWAVRVGLVAAAALVWLLSSLGLPVVLAAAGVALMLLVYLGVARLTAEAGLIWIQPWIPPTAVLIGLFGYNALGPGAVAILGLVGVALCFDVRETLMPFIVNALKLADGQGQRPSRMGPLLAGVFVVGVIVAMVTVLWANYNYGINQNDNFAMSLGRKVAGAVQAAVLGTQDIAATQSLGSWGVLTHMSPDPRFFTPVIAGIAAVLLLSLLRLRLTWWPLHPIIFLVWGTWAMDCFATSFFLGWMIKSGVTHFGGLEAYRRAKTMMIGIIAGEALGGLTFMVIGGVYYLVTGQHGAVYMVLPP